MDADGRGCDWSYRAKIGLTSLGSQRSHPHTIPANIFDSQRSRLLNMPSLEIDMSHRKSSRRSFLAASAALSASAIAAPAVMSATSRKKELHVAAVGVNGMGWSDLSSIGSHASVRFVGFCDIDDRRFDKADAEFRGVLTSPIIESCLASLVIKLTPSLLLRRITCMLRSQWPP